MTETLKQWKRRAEKAEAELEIIHRLRDFEMAFVRAIERSHGIGSDV